MISRYHVAAWRDEADILVCTALIGKRLKKACTVHGAIMGINTNLQDVLMMK
jgi:lipoate-protein ligase B